MQGSNQPTEEQRIRGYIAEARFFSKIKESKRPKEADWFIKVERSPPLLDLRGIDGFAWISRWLLFSRRIPIQLKTRRSDMSGTVSAKEAVRILIHSDMTPSLLMRKLIDALEKVRHLDFESMIRNLEKTPITDYEKQGIALIEKYRQEYR